MGLAVCYFLRLKCHSPSPSLPGELFVILQSLSRFTSSCEAVSDFEASVAASLHELIPLLEH